MNNPESERIWLRIKPTQKLLLISAKDRRDFDRAFLSIRNYCRFPIAGTMFERPVRVKVKSCESSFFPVSIDGDVEAWEFGISAMCIATGRELAWVEGESIRFKSGEYCLLKDAEVTPRE